MNLHLLISDLFWPDSAQTGIYQYLKLPALTTVLAKSDNYQTAGQALESWLCGVFNVNKQQDWPVAPILLQHEKNRIEIGKNYWLRADPVYLRIENNHMLLVDNQILNISLKEAASFTDSINEFLADDGITLLPLHPDRWYLKCTEVPDLQTTLLSEAAGRNINNLLPQGEDRTIWNSKINEIQMLLYEHPLNQAREMQGELPVNSIWVWGGGIKPSGMHTSYTRIWSDHMLARALAEIGGTICHDLPESADVLLNHSDDSDEQLIILNNLQRHACYRDAYSWRNELARMEQNWFAPLLQALKKKQFRQLKLTVINRNSTWNFMLTPGKLWKFWATIHSLETYS